MVTFHVNYLTETDKSFEVSFRMDPAPAPPAEAPVQLRRASNRSARPSAGALSVASLESRYAPEARAGVFGGRRKAGEARERLYIKGTEPENVVDITRTLLATILIGSLYEPSFPPPPPSCSADVTQRAPVFPS